MNTTLMNQVQQVFRNVFQDPSLHIEPGFSASDIRGWESLTHMTLIAELESFFGIAFTFEEVSKFKTIGDMVQCISDKLN
jgi:acyl carrier protein